MTKEAASTDRFELIFRAKHFAFEKHKDQKRRYTGEPYSVHLDEVAALSATAARTYVQKIHMVSTAYLHDCLEDQGVTREELAQRFGSEIAAGVVWLSDLEQGNRATRKALARQRLARAPSWVQSIKVADIISNTASIAANDPKFARIYLGEAELLLSVLENAYAPLKKMAIQQIKLYQLSELNARV